MRDVSGRFVLWVVIVCFATFAAFPFVWMLITTFKETNDLLDPNHNPFLYHSPPTILFIPLAKVVATLHLQDSLWSLVLVYPSFTIPFCTWLMMGFFKAIPKDLEEAAMVDGLSRFEAFTKVILPMSIAGLLTTVIFTLTLVMQEFVYALTFINSGAKFTISTGVPSFLVRGDVYFWGSLMAACFIASVPIAILYNFFVDRFIAGFTVGAVKG
ncbi:MAG: carbohydrate ABC transporter permease [Myxococcales bacterium]